MPDDPIPEDPLPEDPPPEDPPDDPPPPGEDPPVEEPEPPVDPKAGECQFNSNCFIRGRMVAMTGWFSGTFKADEIDVLSDVNIRNGAVSVHYRATIPKVGTLPRFDAQWVLPAQPIPSVNDIILPLTLQINRDYDLGMYARMRLWRDDVLITTTIIMDDDIPNAPFYSNTYLFMSARFVDFDVPANQNVNYRLLIDFPAGEWGKIWPHFKGWIVNSVRRR